MAQAEFPSVHEGEDVEYTLAPEVCAIKNHRQKLIYEIDPYELMPCLKCLPESSECEIKAKCENIGRIGGAVVFLDKIVRRKGFWEELLAALHEQKQGHLAELLEKELKAIKDEEERNAINTATTRRLKRDASVDTSELEHQTKSGDSHFKAQKLQGYEMKQTGPIRRKVSTNTREYQKALAKSAQEGINSIICAPTGSGKTMVASLICQSHLQLSVEDTAMDTSSGDVQPNGRTPKIVVMVPRFAVLLHVYKELKAALPLWNVGKRSGASSTKKTVPFNIFLKNYDVLVITAAIYKNALVGPEKCVDIPQATLLVFDECHHAQKDDPYNIIMSEYIRAKFEHPEASLPQIVGLTASPGAGKRASDLDAVENILTLCANLDTQEICTVSKTHQQELFEFVSIPQKELKVVGNRELDPFTTQVVKLMRTIEKLMGIPFEAVMEERGTQQYESFVQLQHKAAEETHKDHVRKCAEHLKIYNRALQMVSLARISDGLAVLNDYYSDHIIRNDHNKLDKTDSELLSMYQDLLPHLEELLRLEDQYSNPKLDCLKKALLTHYKECKERDEEFRAIIFVKTKQLTQSLKQWMESDENMTMLRPALFTSINAQKEAGGMTPAEQKQITDQFKSGDINVLISTSVGEEGIDIEACNMVVRYNHVTNEIAMVQSRGRARKLKSIEMVIGDDKTSEKDSVNVLLEEKMINAIEHVQQLKTKQPETLSTHIAKKQSESYNSRARIAAQAAVISSRYSAGEIEVHCKNCTSDKSLICHGSDFRLLGQCNNVIPAEEFRDKFIFEEHENEEFKKRGIQRIKCHGCLNSMGITAENFPCLAIKAIKFIRNGMVLSCKKWSKAEFTISPISNEERLSSTS